MHFDIFVLSMRLVRGALGELSGNRGLASCRSRAVSDPALLALYQHYFHFTCLTGGGGRSRGRPKAGCGYGSKRGSKDFTR
jgi:hypothetical protein